MKFKHNDKEVNLLFGTDFIGIFCLELGHEFSDLDKIAISGGSITNEVLSIISDIVFSMAKAYSLLNKTELQIEQYQCVGLIISPSFDTAKFMSELNNALTPTIPQGLPENKSKKK